MFHSPNAMMHFISVILIGAIKVACFTVTCGGWAQKLFCILKGEGGGRLGQCKIYCESIRSFDILFKCC